MAKTSDSNVVIANWARPYKPLKAESSDATFDGGGEPPGGDDMEARVAKLESDMSEIKSDLKTLLRDSAEMKGRLTEMPSTKDFGEMKGRLAEMPSAKDFGDVASSLGKLEGRVDSLPTTAKIASLLAIGVAALTIILRWSEIIAALN